MKIFKMAMITLAFALAGSQAYGATVQKITKKTGAVTIDTGKADGVKKGARYCFYNTKNKRVACGLVSKVTKSSATVMVKKNILKKVKTGYEARPRDEQVVKSNVGDFKIRDNPAEASGHNIKAMYILTLLSQTGYDVPKYSPETFSTALVWDKATEDKRNAPNNLLGMGGEFEYVLSPGMSIAAGVRYKLPNPTPQSLTANRSMSNAQQAEYVETQVESTAFGFWTDFYFLDISLFSGSGIKVGAGVDLDMASLDAVSVHKEDGTDRADPVMEATASTMTLSIRFPVDFYWYFGNFGIGMRATLMYAAVAFGTSNEGNYSDQNAEASVAAIAPENIVAQYHEALDIRANGLAVEILPLSLVYKF